MNKSEVIASVAARADLTQRQAQQCIDALLELICDEVAGDREVKLTGYLKISAVDRKARTGRNIRTGAKVPIPARRGVRIEAGTKLKAAALNGTDAKAPT